MPFWVVMTVVDGVTIEATSAAIGANWCALTASTMRSAPPASAMRSVASTRATISSPFSFRTSPRSRIAFEVLAARHDLDALARRGELGRDVAADRACPDDGDVHALFRTLTLTQAS